MKKAPVMQPSSGDCSENTSVQNSSASPSPELRTREVIFYNADSSNSKRVEGLVHAAAVDAAAEAKKHEGDWESSLIAILRLKTVEELLLHISRIRIFDVDLHNGFISNLKLLEQIKKLKYWYVQPQCAFLLAFSNAAKAVGVACPELVAQANAAVSSGEAARPRMRVVCRKLGMERYLKNEDDLEVAEPHAVYPTSTYRSCDGHVLATEDASLIESVMSTSITTTIKIQAGLLNPSNDSLRNVYGPLGHCVCVIDKFVDGLHGDRLDAYFAAHDIKLTKLAFSGMEADKGIESVEKILWSLKKLGVSRNEPILVVGGGVIADLAGFATALYHRNTPYVMLCTSIVSGIDAGPSPRTCCDGDGYKNLFGSYHPPVLTLTDRTLWSTLKAGWLRHGIAEIIKMAVVKDFTLFELLEDVGPRVVSTRFGALCEEDLEFCRKCDLIVGRAMHSYVQSEYGNLWETHQCRPHAYGHTWSPGYEIPAGMLHGHAVATGMGWGAYLAMAQGFISMDQLHRILRLISDMELSLWHPLMGDANRIFSTQVKIIEKRGGHLCAPVPRGAIGECGYIQERDLPLEAIRAHLVDYKRICDSYPRNGIGLEVHCADVGLEDPSTVAARTDTAQLSSTLAENEELKRKLAKAYAKLQSLGVQCDCPGGHFF